jgi:DeoR/GlpR family transcriptional regulator of sugar metabolism
MEQILTPQEIEARRLVSIQEAAQLLSVSCDTVRRQYKDRFIRVSKRRLALRLRDIMPD